MLTCCLVAVMGLVLGGCASQNAGGGADPGRWSIALHGGAGTPDKTVPAEEISAYRAALAAALDDGIERLKRGDSAVDVVQAVVMRLEDDPKFNAGVGAAFTADGTHELDASIMEGHTLRCGAVAGVTTVKNPTGLARLTMDKTRHVLLTGQGAEKFADEMGVPRVPNSHFATPKRRAMWEEWKAKQVRGDAPSMASRYGTVGCVVLDKQGHLAAATSTGGLTGKKWGRVGDSPVVGAGTYANGFAAVSCTGTGEEFIRHSVARTIAARVELLNEPIEQSAAHLVYKVLKPDDGGVIAMDAKGNVAMPYSSEGMYRAAAKSDGSRMVKIWED